MTPHEIRGLWNLLGQTCGSRFLEQYGTQPNEAWSAFLENVDPMAARQALRMLVLEGSAFPPTLPEFVAAARKSSRDRAVAERNEQTLRALTFQAPTDSEKARENMAKLRATLGLK